MWLIFKKPSTWLAIALIWSLYGNYRSDVMYTEICQAVADLHDGYVDPLTRSALVVATLDPDEFNVLDNEEFQQGFIFTDRKKRELQQAETEIGRAYRWWLDKSGLVLARCGNHLGRAIGTR